jgi:hypothetical protein
MNSVKWLIDGVDFNDKISFKQITDDPFVINITDPNDSSIHNILVMKIDTPRKLAKYECILNDNIVVKSHFIEIIGNLHKRLISPNQNRDMYFLFFLRSKARSRVQNRQIEAKSFAAVDRLQAKKQPISSQIRGVKFELIVIRHETIENIRLVLGKLDNGIGFTNHNSAK